MNIMTVLKEATALLESSGLTNSRLDAEVLLAFCLKKERASFFTHPEEALTEKALKEFQRLVERRKLGEPVAYITGRKEFWSLPFKVNKHVLIPRPETEILVEEVLKICPRTEGINPRILEIGTGSGAISIALASELKNANITATDSSPEAVAIAARNAEISSVTGKITFLVSDLFELMSGKFDIIVSNPPYISKAEYDQLPLGVRGFEPESALLAGVEGTEIHREIIQGGASFLKGGGWLFMEIGAGQKDRIENMLKESHLYDKITFRNDYAGIVRVVVARRDLTGG